MSNKQTQINTNNNKKLEPKKKQNKIKGSPGSTITQNKCLLNRTRINENQRYRFCYILM